VNKWKKVNLGDYIMQVRGVSYKAKDVSNTEKEGYVAILRANNIQDDGLNLSDLIYVEKSKVTNQQFIKAGDILICASSGSKHLVGKAAQAKKDLNMSFGAFCKVVRTDKLYTPYLGYFFKSQYYRRKISDLSAGANINNIRNEHLDQLQIPLPPIEIQRQIAKKLDIVSDVLSLRKKQLTELDNLTKAVFYDMFGDPVKNNKGWKMVQLSDCCHVNPKKSEIDYFTDDLEVSFISMADVSVNGEIDTSDIRKYKDVKKGFTYFYENDVLFAKITPCMENGKGAIARGLKNNIGFGSTEFHVLRPKEGISNSEWLYHLTILPIFRKTAEKNMKGSAGQKRVPASFFDKFLVPLPPIELQNKFADIIKPINEQKLLVRKAIEETQLLFDSLMNQYFSE
jgi:type I restriction enzyme S subunit